MTAFLDTNILIRHLTGDPPDLAARSTAYLASAEELFVPDLIVAETIYVLESFYELPRARVAMLARSVVDFPAIMVVDSGLIHRAVELYEQERLDFAEAYLVACAERTGVEEVASFDRSIDRVQSVRRVEPPRLPGRRR